MPVVKKYIIGDLGEYGFYDGSNYSHEDPNMHDHSVSDANQAMLFDSVEKAELTAERLAENTGGFITIYTIYTHED